MIFSCVGRLLKIRNNTPPKTSSATSSVFFLFSLITVASLSWSLCMFEASFIQLTLASGSKSVAGPHREKYVPKCCNALDSGFFLSVNCFQLIFCLGISFAIFYVFILVVFCFQYLVSLPLSRHCGFVSAASLTLAFPISLVSSRVYLQPRSVLDHCCVLLFIFLHACLRVFPHLIYGCCFLPIAVILLYLNKSLIFVHLPRSKESAFGSTFTPIHDKWIKKRLRHSMMFHVLQHWPTG